MNYGPRTTTSNSISKEKQDDLCSKQRQSQTQNESVSLFPKWLDRLITYPVPHAWFLHFYILAILSSLFWGIQITTQGQVLRSLAGNNGKSKTTNEKDIELTMSANQIVLVWILMTIQGTRRLLECLTPSKPSSSKMGTSLYLVGMLFYGFEGVAIWIEGAPEILSPHDNASLLGIDISAPSARTMLCIVVFAIASILQNTAHRHLFSLPKYTLPPHPLFRKLICPHYTAECVIYASLAVLAAPGDEWINMTMATVFIFVLVNLGASAESARTWSCEKFGKEKVKNKWRMIPFVF